MKKKTKKRLGYFEKTSSAGTSATLLFMKKKKEFREKNNALLDANMMYLSDELDEKETLNEK